MLAVHFQKPTDFASGGFLLVAMPCVFEKRVVTAVSRPIVKLRPVHFREFGGAIIDDSARGLRTVFHLTRAFQKFDPRHAACLGRVVGIRCGVGRGCG